MKKEFEGIKAASGYGVIDLTNEMEVDASTASGPTAAGPSPGPGRGEDAADGRDHADDAQVPGVCRARIVAPGGAGEGEKQFWPLARS